MALRIANKIHSIVNNVVLRSSTAATVGVRQTQGLKLQLCLHNVNSNGVATTSTQATPKMRYPLNHQDANSYIDQLKTYAFIHNAIQMEEGAPAVRTFTVNVHTRRAAHGVAKGSVGLKMPSSQGFSQAAHRFFASKGKDCKIGKQKPKDKCPKMGDKKKTCPTFKLENCKQSPGPEAFDCTRRKYVFTDCKKRPAPYPSFSESCYEDPFNSIHECRDCPWGIDKHPTFKKQTTKIGQQKKKFHTDAHRFLTLRYGCDGNQKKVAREQEIQKKLYDDLNNALFEAKSVAKNIRPVVVKLSAIPPNVDVEMNEQLRQMKVASQHATPINRQHVEMLLMGRKYDRHAKKNQLGDPRRHKMRRRRKKGKCRKPCRKFRYQPPKKYDIKKKARKFRKWEEKKKKSKSTCICKGFVKAELDYPLDSKIGSHNEANLMSCASEGGASGKRAPTGDCTPNLIMDGVVLSEMLCKMKKQLDRDGNQSGKCEILDESPVCPTNLLDRKPYPKYRKVMKKRLAKEKELEKKRRAKRGPPKGKKKANGVEEGGEIDAVRCASGVNGMFEPLSGVSVLASHVEERPPALRPHNIIRRDVLANEFLLRQKLPVVYYDKCIDKFDFKPLPEEQQTEQVQFISEMKEREEQMEAIREQEEMLEETLTKLENMIMAKDRVRVTGPPQCPKSDCNQGPVVQKKKCPKRIKQKICPKDLLDRKPYKRFREGKKKHRKRHHKRHQKGKKHRKGHKKHHRKGKHASQISDEEMTAMLVSEPNHSSRPSI